MGSISPIESVKKTLIINRISFSISVRNDKPYFVFPSFQPFQGNMDFSASIAILHGIVKENYDQLSYYVIIL